MRQVVITKAGSPDVLRVVDVPLPEPGPGSVRIKTESIGVNFADLVGRLGLYPDAPKPPYVPGYEVAGRIDAVGSGVDASRLGEPVIALTRFNGYADAVCVPEAQAIPRPAKMSVEQAGGFLVSYLTAYASLVVMAGIKPHDRVLIHAAAGGVGLAAIDLCKVYGATIYGTASPAKHDFLRARGVQFPIDYRSKDFETEVKRLTDGRGVQIALDAIGGKSWTKSYRSLSSTGRLVINGVTSLTPRSRRSPRALLRMAFTTPWLRFNPIALANDNKGVVGVNLGRLWDETAMLREWVTQLFAWYDTGRIDIHIDRTFPLADAAAAHRYLHERRNTGKVVLVP
ncbi:MAG TPA: medium chain dehydrogenase/reductase family protein [Aggregatilinea sp.]|uniref:synaptic vesicle VAT-1 family membrane protein n=1 Tax=Aggregatilinea sp. TaxID=2806333 RepID=UPI002BF38124|nr:medium chain dehydrogenase/reductase family protein [Aggregatilinea sp.]HML23201.1 medium chain dehydrogenase/reductase family protein [Aggregatilinea sp.]